MVRTRKKDAGGPIAKDGSRMDIVGRKETQEDRRKHGIEELRKPRAIETYKRIYGEIEKTESAKV